MGLFSRSKRRKSVALCFTPVRLGWYLSALVGATFQHGQKICGEWERKANPLELFQLGLFGTAGGAARHPLVASLSAAQRQLAIDSLYVFSYRIWTDGPEKLIEEMPEPLDWPRYESFLQIVDWPSHQHFVEMARQRGEEYDALVQAYLSSSHRATTGSALGDGIARHLFGTADGEVDPAASTLGRILFISSVEVVGDALEGHQIRADPEAEANAAALPEPVDYIVLLCQNCGQKNRVHLSRWAEASCGRCHAPL
jgi:hypothetical protein